MRSAVSPTTNLGSDRFASRPRAELELRQMFRLQEVRTSSSTGNHFKPVSRCSSRGTTAS